MTLTNEVTNVVSNILTNVQTVTGAAKTVLQTNIQTQVESFTVIVTSNAAGQVITETATIGGGSQPTASSSSNTNPVPAGAITGGVVGGLACISTIGFLFFLGFRRGWFSKKQQYTPSNTLGIDGGPSS